MKFRPEIRIEKRGLLSLRLERELGRLAAREGLDSDKLRLMLRRMDHLCGICLEAFPMPHVYRVDGVPRAVICTLCVTAIGKSGGDPEALGRLRRFDRRYKDRRVRIRRLMDLSMVRGPFDEGFEG